MHTKLHTQTHSWYHCSTSAALPADTCPEWQQKEGESGSQHWYSLLSNLPFPTKSITPPSAMSFSMLHTCQICRGLYYLPWEYPMSLPITYGTTHKYFCNWKDWMLCTPVQLMSNIEPCRRSSEVGFGRHQMSTCPFVGKTRRVEAASSAVLER